MLIVLLHIPAIQSAIGEKTADALGKKLGTKVEVGSVYVGLPGHVVINGVELYDQQGRMMLTASRLSANAEILPLLSGRISISSAQLFGVKASLYKENGDAAANFQFVLDSLASKSPKQEKTPLDLHIHSLIVRNSAVTWDRKDIAPTRGRFNTAHLSVSAISAHIILNKLTNDSLSLNCKRLSMKEQSGLVLKGLSFKVNAGRSAANIADFRLSLPNTTLSIPHIQASYTSTNGNIDMQSLKFDGQIDRSRITLSDISSVVPQLRNFNSPLFLSSAFDGTGNSVKVRKLSLNSSDNGVSLACKGAVRKTEKDLSWSADIETLSLNAATIKFISENLKGQSVSIPDEVMRLGNAAYRGQVSGTKHSIKADGLLATEAGNADISLSKAGRGFTGSISTSGIDLRKILSNDHFGSVAANIDVSGLIKDKGVPDLDVKGLVSHLDYNGHTYRNIGIDGQYQSGTLSGTLNLDDPDGQVSVEGTMDTQAASPSVSIAMSATRLNTGALNLGKEQMVISGEATADFTGKDINHASGTLSVRDLTLEKGDETYQLDELNLTAGYKGKEHFISLTSDFGHATLSGTYEYSTLVSSIAGIVKSKLPTMPGLPQTIKTGNNSFTIDAELTDARWLKALTGTDIVANESVRLSGRVEDAAHSIDMALSMPSFDINGNGYRNGLVKLTTKDDVLYAESNISQVGKKGGLTDLHLTAFAADNHMTSSLSIDDNKPHGLRGVMNVDANFYKSETGKATAAVRILPSQVLVGDTVWKINPSSITYSAKDLTVKDFAIEHGSQHIRLSGHCSATSSDSLMAELNDVDVAYILNLVNFHSVEFGGRATGHAVLRSLFSTPSATALLTVRDFLFENGRMGTLHARADWNKTDNQIDIDAIALDEPDASTKIDGYVSLKNSYIDLGIAARKTRIEFMEEFCGSFMRDVEARADGFMRVAGPLKTINLEGEMVVNGDIGISSLNTTYTLVNDTVRFTPDNIVFEADTIYDRNHNYGIVSGRVTHQHLGRFAYDIDITAQNLLAYDFKSYGNSTFFGTVFGTGRCGIKGKSGEIDIDVDVTPQRGSFIEYNAVSPDAINKQEFITWYDRTQDTLSVSTDTTNLRIHEPQSIDLASDMHINFLINCTPDASLRLLMDEQSGDRITLNGSGVIRASYYNKGAFQMFGNYIVDHGTYKLTIQNVIKKDFSFRQGGTITFGGDPYDAVLNLMAQYQVSGVSLSDLNIGRTFSGNTIKVNCLMNINGTPNAPHIDFGMEMPTLSADVEQMVRSLMNTEEETNQQVLYLLAVGRFYNSGNNNATQEGAAQQSQTSLAMQSLLSGTISQQLNNVLSSFVNNNNWNFGANISTGDEGWNNAEYEGLLSGRMLNNRLLFNGQFGYRDNANATTSFIGDFDIRYLLFPNGNLAINIYNQANDRYFTRNSLNTQGVGLIMKKDFSGWRDLFGFGKKKKSKK